ncbi:LysR family transcriptional regulator [Ramlibacter henchirensis]|uniref:LysR family transcriptional regulator n=1 Tax=Ramlibacter henchirensis TaxID=204072 RepID=A0A4Z0C4M4_9BURK|nr:LysR family transcriptional regulator [Ramlibacter henchirensis]TFZ06513.1 LysR family transcriptional regulator [Ramlibacter henchirensis]
MDRFRAIEVFVAIADHGSLTAAARALDSSLPAVVRTLAAYEASLRVRLFNRTTRRVTLTDEGRLHLAHCRDVMERLRTAEAELTSGAAEPAGQLTITAPVLFGELYIAPVVTRFVARHPQLRCSVLLVDRLVNLLEEGIDAGIRIGRLEDSSLVAHQLGSVRRVVVASPAYLRRNGTPKHPRDLGQHNCIRLIAGPNAWGGFQERGRPLQVTVRGNLEFNQVLPAVQACANDAGVGQFFSYQVAPLVAGRKLKIVLQSFELPPVPISIVYPHARLLPARTRALVDWMRQEITQFRD